MPHQRRQRVAESLRVEIARILRAGMHDPRLGFLTVTGVDLSPDLRHARIHVSVLGDEAKQSESMRALEGARGYLRRELAHTLPLRRMPDLAFRLDTSGERGERIERILREIAGPPAEAGVSGEEPGPEPSPDDGEETPT